MFSEVIQVQKSPEHRVLYSVFAIFVPGSKPSDSSQHASAVSLAERTVSAIDTGPCCGKKVHVAQRFGSGAAVVADFSKVFVQNNLLRICGTACLKLTPTPDDARHSQETLH